MTTPQVAAVGGARTAEQVEALALANAGQDFEIDNLHPDDRARLFPEPATKVDE